MAAPLNTTILIVDDDPANLESVDHVLRHAGYTTLLAAGAQEALDQLRKTDIDLILTDYKMPLTDGLDLLKMCKAIRPNLDVILMTAHGTIEMAVEAMRLGAYDFLTKPFKKVALLRAVEKCLERRSLFRENQALKRELKRYAQERPLLGHSAAMLQLFDQISQVAPSSATVLLQGESGTGKELAARMIHDQSPRGDRPFVTLNCAALPETLLEAELFGYERGAFTGAHARKEGRFESARGGSLFLDEIGELSPTVQVKLLRVLQDGSFERLGSSQTLSPDVRILAATHRNLEELVEEKRFREDLYYRLNVITLSLPPLRHRTDDIPLLAEHFLSVYAKKNQKSVTRMDPGFLEKLKAYSWPGNVRELENTLERAVVLSRAPVLTADLLPDRVGAVAQTTSDHWMIPFGTPLAEVERLLINDTLRRTQGDKTLAAQLLGITSRTIYRKLET